jgi:hypothetical protein
MLWLIVACLRYKSAFLSRHVVISGLFFFKSAWELFRTSVDRLLARRDPGASLAALLAVSRPLLVVHAISIALLSAPGENALHACQVTAIDCSFPACSEVLLNICIVCRLGHGGACLRKASSPRLHVSAARGETKRPAEKARLGSPSRRLVGVVGVVQEGFRVGSRGPHVDRIGSACERFPARMEMTEGAFLCGDAGEVRRVIRVPLSALVVFPRGLC